MKKKLIIKTFTRFLKKNDVYDLYLTNLKNCREQETESIDFIINCINRSPDELILGAFPWCSLPTQKKSWGGLHKEWHSLLLKKKLI